MGRLFGTSAALLLPVREDGTVDAAGLARHAGWCLTQGCDSVTVFGTTGEGASLDLEDRERILRALVDSGIAPRRAIHGGVAAASVGEAVGQARQLLDADCRGILLAPPFYFKNVGDDGLFAWFSRVFDALGPAARDVILYNIPSVTAVALSVDLIARLRAAYPEVVVGVKDSSGAFAHTEALLGAHSDIAILVGDERDLARAMKVGAAGSISGLANLVPGDLARIIEGGEDVARIPKLVDAVLRHPVVPAVKALMAHRTGDAGWRYVLPPLMPLGDAAAKELAATFDGLFGGELG